MHWHSNDSNIAFSANLSSQSLEGIDVQNRAGRSQWVAAARCNRTPESYKQFGKVRTGNLRAASGRITPSWDLLGRRPEPLAPREPSGQVSAFAQAAHGRPHA